jgi:hypothetical protein
VYFFAAFGRFGAAQLSVEGQMREIVSRAVAQGTGKATIVPKKPHSDWAGYFAGLGPWLLYAGAAAGVGHSMSEERREFL